MKRGASLIEKTFLVGLEKYSMRCIPYRAQWPIVLRLSHIHWRQGAQGRRQATLKTIIQEEKYISIHLPPPPHPPSLEHVESLEFACQPHLFSITFTGFHARVRVHVPISCPHQPITDFRQGRHPTVRQTSVITDHEEAKHYRAADSGQRSKTGFG